MGVIKVSNTIQQDNQDDIAFQHVVLCHLGFPRSKTDRREFERRSGVTSLRLKAGEVYDGQHWIPQPLPYGSIPRLMMIATITRATQQKTREIKLGRSMRESLRNLGLADTGATNWRRVARQQTALAAVTMILGFVSREGQAKTVQTLPFTKITAWVHRDGQQLTLYPSLIVLSKDFYDVLETNSVPLDMAAVRTLAKYPLALDIYTWLAHRLCRVRKRYGEQISWEALREQFGQEISEQRTFNQLMRDAMKRVQLVYPKARFDIFENGITLVSSPPPVPKTRVLSYTGSFDSYKLRLS